MHASETYAALCEAMLSALGRGERVRFAMSENRAGYGFDSSERCVEVPWALSQYGGEKRVLDVGVSLADPAYFAALLSLQDIGVEELHGVDIVPFARTRHRFAGLSQPLLDRLVFRQADARATGYPESSFDLIFMISVLEHIGFDEACNAPDTVFNRSREKPTSLPDIARHEGDLCTLKELHRILKPGGALVYSVPFGTGRMVVTRDSKQRHALFLEYGVSRWRQLLAQPGWRVAEQRFFGQLGDGWREVPDPAPLEHLTYRDAEGVAAAVACARLVKC